MSSKMLKFVSTEKRCLKNVWPKTASQTSARFMMSLISVRPKRRHRGVRNVGFLSVGLIARCTITSQTG